MLFTDKTKWAQSCAALGALNHLAEKSTYTDLGQEHMQEYAVCKGNYGLCGVWHPVKKQGMVYTKPRQAFSTKGRSFVQEKLSAYT